MNTSLGTLGTIDEETIFDLESLANGDAEIPDDADMATEMILEEIIRMGKDIEVLNDENQTMTAKEFSQFWNGVNEHTQS